MLLGHPPFVKIRGSEWHARELQRRRFTGKPLTLPDPGGRAPLPQAAHTPSLNWPPYLPNTLVSHSTVAWLSHSGGSSGKVLKLKRKRNMRTHILKPFALASLVALSS